MTAKQFIISVTTVVPLDQTEGKCTSEGVVEVILDFYLSVMQNVPANPGIQAPEIITSIRQYCSLFKVFKDSELLPYESLKSFLC